MRIKITVMSLVLVALIAGCATPKPANTPLEKPDELTHEVLNTNERFRKYESVGLVPFDNSEAVLLSVDRDEERETEAFVRMANTYLEEGFLNEMGDIFYPRYGIIQSEADYDRYDLVIEGKYLEFDRGNQASRYWLGTGHTRVVVVGTMTETATGKVVVEFRDIKYGTGGSFGGDSIELMQENCEQIGGNISDFLEEVY